MSCNELCEKYRAKRNHNIPSRYTEGQKRCSICEIFIKWNENNCPCCNYKLRTRSFRGFGMKKRFREEIVNRY
jgi:hypothetical protein